MFYQMVTWNFTWMQEKKAVDLVPNHLAPHLCYLQVATLLDLPLGELPILVQHQYPDRPPDSVQRQGSAHRPE